MGYHIDQSEIDFEKDVVDYLTSLGWKYEADIKTSEQLWQNFKEILEVHNQNVLDRPLSTVEFAQVRKNITDIKSPYEAGQFLYGFNGVSQIEIDLDDGKHVFLTVFDTAQIGAGDTIYQVVNQIERPAIIAGKKDRRFDVTLLVNGLPVIQIELKRATHDVNEALNQMHQYIMEAQYSDIFSLVQMLVAMTPNNVKYMANTTADRFNKDFAFCFQDQDSNVVRDWKTYCGLCLNSTMAHKMVTCFTILDGTLNNNTLKVMRPYQIYAVQKIIEKLKNSDPELGKQLLGYIWHTTGSGKTITSFKAAWLTRLLPGIDKVVFVVDRIQLTTQTKDNYSAYAPDTTGKESGVVMDTSSTRDLSAKLKAKDSSIIVTSVQKLDALVKSKYFKSPEKRILFIVDEAHRSTSGESFQAIQEAFKKASWIGFSGTPMFDISATGVRTEDIFGPCLHSYTIREGIADHNVLGFKVDFKTTITPEEARENYLPQFFEQKYPDWTDEQIQEKIANMTPEDMDDAIESSFYDNNIDHVKLVVADIYENWQNRSVNGKYNAILTTHVGGGKASIPMAMMYYKEFHRVNENRKKDGLPILKVTVTFSENNSNDDYMIGTNSDLDQVIKDYDVLFGTQFGGIVNVDNYTQDVISRLNKSASDGNYLDLVIVVDQLLTGFDAPGLNTLYVDRTLKGAALIQAYSRTNRIDDNQDKPWGRIVHYRWPALSEKYMNEALAVYANKDSANLSDEERRKKNVEDGITAPDFEFILNSVKEIASELSELTNHFVQLPPSETDKYHMFELLKDYNSEMSKLKQYDSSAEKPEDNGFDYNNPDVILDKIGIKPDEELLLTTVLANELKKFIADQKSIPVYQVDLQMTKIKDVKIDYDYLTELVNQLLNAVHEGREKEADETKDKIYKWAYGIDDQIYAKKIMDAADAIRKGDYPDEEAEIKYPANIDDCAKVINAAHTAGIDKVFLEFRLKWGITEIISNKEIHKLFERHQYGRQDLDDAGAVSDLIRRASEEYLTLASDKDVLSLSKIKYRNALRMAIYEMADNLAEK